MQTKKDKMLKILLGLQKFFESFPLFFISFVIIVLLLGVILGSNLIPPHVTRVLNQILGILLGVGTSALIGYFAKISQDMEDKYQQQVNMLSQHYEKERTEIQKEREQLLDQLNSWRDTLVNSLRVIHIKGQERIFNEIIYRVNNSHQIIFFGNFNKEYQKVLSGDEIREVIICDTTPQDDLLLYHQYEYRFLYKDFKADLLVFYYNNKVMSMLIFSVESEKEAWVVNFDLSKALGLEPDDFPIFYLPEQIKDQILSDNESSPIIKKARYREKLPQNSLVNREFSLVLQTISNGYMKPIFPPTDIKEVIDRWNERIFRNFVDYARGLLKRDNFKELLITWKIDIDFPQTILHYKIFENWISEINQGNYSIRRIILIDRQDLNKTLSPPINIEMSQCSTYRDVVENLTGKVILRNYKNNPNYRYCFANIAHPNFPLDCKKDFAVFLFEGNNAIIQTSELDLDGKLLKLFFRLPINKQELSTYIDFFNQCFSNETPPYVYQSSDNALKP